MALWGTGVWGTAKWTEQVGSMAATETGVDVFSGEGDVVVAGTMAATESTVDTFAAVGVVTIVGQMAAVETGVDTFAAEGDVQIVGDMSAIESGVDTFSAEGDVNLNGTMAATETGVDVFSAEGDVIVGGTMAAVETGEDVFAATGKVEPAVQPVTADIGDERHRRKAQKKRDEEFEREKREREGLRQQIKQTIDPVVAKAAPVVVSKGTKSVQVLSLDGSRIGINVPPAFDAAEVARLVADVLEEARVQSRLVAQRQEAERARQELARIIKRRREDELLLLID